MQLAKIVGSVVSTQKAESLMGKKLLLVVSVDVHGETSAKSGSTPEVAIDCAGAGDGDLVLVTRGSSARAVLGNPQSAADLCIVAIVDSLSVEE